MEQDGEGHQKIIMAEMLEGLPEPVQRYLNFTGIVGQPWIQKVRLKQRGSFRTGADQPWMPMTAEEFYTVDPPTLTWNARFKLFGLPLLRARDHYENGWGHMYGRLAGLYTIFDVRGEEINQATMMRYLNEIMWFPTAFLAKTIRWESIDDDSARVIFTDVDKNVSAVMHFDGDGRPVNFTCQRYRDMGGTFSLDPWSTPVIEYGVRAGLNLPVRGQAVWNLATGDLTYADFKITEANYYP